jgi:hypothetical protein
MGGPVIKGFGRGSKVLGIPTGISPILFSTVFFKSFSFDYWFYDDDKIQLRIASYSWG